MDIAEEGSWVLLNLGDVEASASVGTSLLILNAGREWAGKTASADADVLLASLDGVGEGETRWAGFTLWCFVDVGWDDVLAT